MDFLKGMGNLPVTEEDKEWIEENFEWLIQNVGVLPLADAKLIDHTDELFHKSSPEEIAERLCEILEIEEAVISISLYEDIKSKEWTVIAPMGEYEDFTSDCIDFEEDGTLHVKITIAKSLLQDKVLLTSSLAYQLSRVKLRLLNLEFDAGPDTGVFLYLAAIYFGFGLFISNSVFVNDKGWISKSNIPLEVVGYSLAYYCWLKNDRSSLTKHLSDYIKPHFESSYKYIEENPPEIFNQNYISDLIKASRIQEAAFKCYDNQEYEKAVEIYKELEAIDPENPAVFNNLGFFKLRLNMFNESIENFDHAIQLDPEFAFAYDNKGFALLMLDKLDEGYQYINQSLLLDEYNSYGYRNLGIYFHKKLDYDTSYQYFEKALDLDPTTELIHYYFGMAKLENGDFKEALQELELSATLGERESLMKLLEIKSRDL